MDVENVKQPRLLFSSEELTSPPLVFLDVDGVLHPSGYPGGNTLVLTAEEMHYASFELAYSGPKFNVKTGRVEELEAEKLDLVAQICAVTQPPAEVVLTSSWRLNEDRLARNTAKALLRMKCSPSPLRPGVEQALNEVGVHLSGPTPDLSARVSSVHIAACSLPNDN